MWSLLDYIKFDNILKKFEISDNSTLILDTTELTNNKTQPKNPHYVFMRAFDYKTTPVIKVKKIDYSRTQFTDCGRFFYSLPEFRNIVRFCGINKIKDLSLSFELDNLFFFYIKKCMQVEPDFLGEIFDNTCLTFGYLIYTLQNTPDWFCKHLLLDLFNRGGINYYSSSFFLDPRCDSIASNGLTAIYGSKTVSTNPYFARFKTSAQPKLNLVTYRRKLEYITPEPKYMGMECVALIDLNKNIVEILNFYNKCESIYVEIFKNAKCIYKTQSIQQPSFKPSIDLNMICDSKNYRELNMKITCGTIISDVKFILFINTEQSYATINFDCVPKSKVSKSSNIINSIDLLSYLFSSKLNFFEIKFRSSLTMQITWSNFNQYHPVADCIYGSNVFEDVLFTEVFALPGENDLFSTFLFILSNETTTKLSDLHKRLIKLQMHSKNIQCKDQIKDLGNERLITYANTFSNYKLIGSILDQVWQYKALNNIHIKISTQSQQYITGYMADDDLDPLPVSYSIYVVDYVLYSKTLDRCMMSIKLNYSFYGTRLNTIFFSIAPDVDITELTCVNIIVPDPAFCVNWEFSISGSSQSSSQFVLIRDELAQEFRIGYNYILNNDIILKINLSNTNDFLLIKLKITE